MKLVQEITGHISDSVHTYQTMSDFQRMGVSGIIQGDINVTKLSEVAPMELVVDTKKKTDAEKFELSKFELPFVNGK